MHFLPVDTYINLTTWQKKQAALLYHFASLDYLKGLQQRVSDLLAFMDPRLDLAQVQNRDSVLASTRWGTRNTSQNWANNAWPFLKDFQLSIAKDIADRAMEIYRITGTDQCGRGMSEYSMQWASPDEEDKFNALFEAISRYAGKIDYTMDKYETASKWKDFSFAVTWPEFKDQFPKLPKFQVRTDVVGETGKVPVRTGVYVPQDDPYGALQFAWTGGGNGQLLECATFNQLGLNAFNTLGRTDLWMSGNKMAAFAQANITNPLLLNDHLYKHSQKEFLDDSKDPELAPSLVARNAFTSRPCKWYFVEMVNGEFEDIDDTDINVKATPVDRMRVEGGQRCPQAGYWLTPAKVGSRRHFKEGEIMPVFGSDYGATIWQWDSSQG